MTDHVMDGIGWMMWAGGLFWLVLLTLLTLDVAALVKHLRITHCAEPK